MGNKCYNGGSKHKFKARYEEVELEPKVTFRGILLPMSAEEYRKLLVKKVYVKDVCVWCGKTIKKDQL